VAIQSRANVVPTSRRSQEMGGARSVPVAALGLSLSAFFVLSYGLCVIGYLVGFPVDHAVLAIFLPGFTLLNWRSFLIGLAESFAWGWYIALVFGPLYNFFVRRLR